MLKSQRSILIYISNNTDNGANERIERVTLLNVTVRLTEDVIMYYNVHLIRDFYCHIYVIHRH